MSTKDERTEPGRTSDGHLQYLITAYLFENISDAGRREVEGHLAKCAECRSELEELRATLLQVEDAIAPDAPETPAYSFEARRLERVLSAAKQRGTWSWIVLRRRTIGLAAAALICIGVFVMTVLSRARSSREEMLAEVPAFSGRGAASHEDFRLGTGVDPPMALDESARGETSAAASPPAEGQMFAAGARAQTPAATAAAPVVPTEERLARAAKPAAAAPSDPIAAGARRYRANEAKDGSDARVPMTLSTTDQAEGLVAEFEWTTNSTAGGGKSNSDARSHLFAETTAKPDSPAKAEKADASRPDDKPALYAKKARTSEEPAVVAQVADGLIDSVTDFGSVRAESERAPEAGQTTARSRRSGAATGNEPKKALAAKPAADRELSDKSESGEIAMKGLTELVSTGTRRDPGTPPQPDAPPAAGNDTGKGKTPIKNLVTNESAAPRRPAPAETPAPATVAVAGKATSAGRELSVAQGADRAKLRKLSEAEKSSELSSKAKDDAKSDDVLALKDSDRSVGDLEAWSVKESKESKDRAGEESLEKRLADGEEADRKRNSTRFGLPVAPGALPRSDTKIVADSGGAGGGLGGNLSRWDDGLALGWSFGVDKNGLEAQKQVPGLKSAAEGRKSATENEGKPESNLALRQLRGFDTNEPLGEPAGGSVNVESRFFDSQDNFFAALGVPVGDAGRKGVDSSSGGAELALRGYHHYQSLDQGLKPEVFFAHPVLVPAPTVGDEGLGEAGFRVRYGVNPFVDTQRDHLSTFGMDVDTASYTNARGLLNAGTLPDSKAVRVEEFINYFREDVPANPGAVFVVRCEGGPSPFGEGLDLLKVTVKARELLAGERKDAVLTFAVDTSGSMNLDDRLGLVRSALETLAQSLKPDDRVAIVAFGANPYLVLPHTPARERERILDAVHSLAPGGGTNVEAGLDLAYRVADEVLEPKAINRVILCSDGVANVGARGPEEILKKAEVFAKRGIYLSCIGVGRGKYNDAMLETLSKKGNGNYAYVDSPAAASEIFQKNLPSTLQVLAQDAKIQVDFNADVVSHYRLLGYEKRDIADSDFRNDKVDAGEVGPGSTVTVLYEIRRKANASGELGRIYLRYRDTGTGRVDEVNYPLPPGVLAVSLGETSDRFRFIAGVAETAELLRGSYWARNGSYGRVLSLLNSISPAYRALPEWQEVVDLVARAQALTIDDLSKR